MWNKCPHFRGNAYGENPFKLHPVVAMGCVKDNFKPLCQDHIRSCCCSTVRDGGGGGEEEKGNQRTTPTLLGSCDTFSSGG